jgi:hypothetical protein
VKGDGGDKECWLRRLCDWLHHREHWQSQFVNGSALGLKPVGKGYYGLKLAPGEEVIAEVEFTGAAMPVPSMAIHVPPGAGGQVLSPASGAAAVAVPIPSGGMVTVVARGMIGALSNQDDAGGNVQMHNANGFSARQLDGSKFLLSSKAFAPWQMTGALIGAFTPDFSDSFFIGTENTFYAKPGATTLYLAVNDVAGQYGDNSGAGFDLNVVATPPTTLPTKLSWPANDKLGLPGRPQPAANLPVLTIDFLRVDRAQNTTIPIGYVSYAVYDTHVGKNDQGIGIEGGKNRRSARNSSASINRASK